MSEFCFDGDSTIHRAIDIINASLERNSWQTEVVPIGLMLLDLQMPRKNGMQVIEHLRRYIESVNVNSSCKVIEPTFVFLTAYSSKAFKQHAKNLGVENVFEKPLQLE